MDLYELFAILFFASCGITIGVSFGYCIGFSASNGYKCSCQTSIRNVTLSEIITGGSQIVYQNFGKKKRKIFEVDEVSYQENDVPGPSSYNYSDRNGTSAMPDNHENDSEDGHENDSEDGHENDSEDQENDSEDEHESEEQELEADKKPRFALVELSQLEKLLQRCLSCGRLPAGPGGRLSHEKRNIVWIKKGTNMTAVIRCSCNNYKRSRWFCQDVVSGTNMRTGNIVLTAAAQVAPVSFPDLSAMFRAANIACIGKSTFQQISKSYIWPCVEDEYYKQLSDLLISIPDPVSIAVDGQYDSPGFNAELAAVTAIEETSKQVINISVVEKKEVDGVSGRMELAGVKKCLEKIESKVSIVRITVDKHPQVCKYLREQNKDYCFDPWHNLRNTKNKIRQTVNELEDPEDKEILKAIGKRFIIHVYKSVELSRSPEEMKQMVFSFFLHVMGIHEWTQRKFTELIPCPLAKPGKKFENESFQQFTKCLHNTDPILEHHPDVNPNSLPYQKLLGIASKTAFINDLEHLRYGNMTSEVESFHSVIIRYRPKRKFYPIYGFEKRSMLAALAWNENKKAEQQGKRGITSFYECYSKSKGGMRRKYKKGRLDDKWKRKIVDDAIERKRQQGPGLPLSNADLDDGIADVIVNPFEGLQFLENPFESDEEQTDTEE